MKATKGIFLCPCAEFAMGRVCNGPRLLWAEFVMGRDVPEPVSTIERLVRRLRETGRVADRPRSGRPRVTSQRQDRAIRLAHLRNRHLTATETAVNTVGSHNHRIHPIGCASLVYEPVVLPSVCHSIGHVARVVWLG